MSLAVVTQRLAERFAASFPEAPRGHRRVGREAEYPIVRADGTAAEVTDLWPALMAPGDLKAAREGDLIVELDGPRYTYALEVGRGTIEVVTGPTNDLFELRSVHEEAMARLLAACRPLGIRVLAMGFQPVTAGTPEHMSAKKRYHTLLSALGDAWLWFAVTSSDQLHVDVSRDEVIPLMNLAHQVTGAIVALCANSGVANGADGGVCSLRATSLDAIHREHGRHGIPLRPSTCYEDYVADLIQSPFLFRREDGQPVRDGRPFTEWLAEAETRGFSADAQWDGFQLHEHYVWRSARPRVKQATIELRAACQQPWSEHTAAGALGLGLIEAADDLRALLAERGIDWEAGRRWRDRTARDGLAAEEPSPGLTRALLDRAQAALVRRGRGEEVLLAPLFTRLERRENPAQVARRLLAEGGIPAVLDAFAV